MTKYRIDDFPIDCSVVPWTDGLYWKRREIKLTDIGVVLGKRLRM